ncbi:MAG TPA: hypothetical protein VF025_07245 [Gaiellaceae bacterium]
MTGSVATAEAEIHAPAEALISLKAPEALDLLTFPFRRGTLILEPGPGPGSEPRFRLMQRRPGGIAHSSGGDYDLTAKEALYLLFCALGPGLGLTPEDLGLTPEDVAAAA